MSDPYNSISDWVYDLVERARGTHQHHRTNIPLLTRYTAHLGIIALTIIGLLLSGIEIRAAGSRSADTTGANGELPPIQLGDPNGLGSLFVPAVPFTSSGQQPPVVDQSAPPDTANVIIPAVPFTIAPRRTRDQVVEYVVQPGDTVTGIAKRFGVTADSIIWANTKLQDNAELLTIGQTVNIPPTSGVLYTVVKGDTVSKLAARFHARTEDVLNDEFNRRTHNLPSLTVGQFLMVPGGEKPAPVQRPIITGTSPAPATAPRGTATFITPVRGCQSQNFWSHHPGIDIATPKGTPIYAADSGYAMIVGWDNTGYGNMVLLNHGNGYLTRYGHLSAFKIQPGQSVKKGDLIGLIGSTGHSTGPHLHFEIIQAGVRRNPAFFIKVPGWCPGLH